MQSVNDEPKFNRNYFVFYLGFIKQQLPAVYPTKIPLLSKIQESTSGVTTSGITTSFAKSKYTLTHLWGLNIELWFALQVNLNAGFRISVESNSYISSVQIVSKLYYWLSIFAPKTIQLCLSW